MILLCLLHQRFQKDITVPSPGFLPIFNSRSRAVIDAGSAMHASVRPLRLLVRQNNVVQRAQPDAETTADALVRHLEVPGTSHESTEQRIDQCTGNPVTDGNLLRRKHFTTLYAFRNPEQGGSACFRSMECQSANPSQFQGFSRHRSVPQ